MKQYQRKSWQALSMIFAMCLALVGAASLSACSDDDPHFTVSEDDYPRILNTDLSDKTIDRKTPLQMEIKVTPMHYTTVTWLLDDVQIAEGSTIDQFLPVGSHVLFCKDDYSYSICLCNEQTPRGEPCDALEG